MQPSTQWLPSGAMSSELDDPICVCYPPPGFVPLSFMEGPDMPWTVIPDALRFQPTSSTAVRVFHVRINRHKQPSAVRLQEVPVKHMAVDCYGESFCLIFWSSGRPGGARHLSRVHHLSEERRSFAMVPPLPVL
eukprot:Skav200564  [mRNA]  locus=scaffold917:84941:90774:- [translate_table: standard]